ncbi:type IV pilin-like G/H family protein [Nostoc sp. FACHB-110]|uniref:type IV pilin-like G/H family protein n=1 Tax=Nostoc sp. FACHB-110 TaxID=2692834 RepID=UPI001684E616|nr:type IV pilin-like G/H family protein [Nostoc sp. FACHB-110]MBD2435504.1 hypothetical protein [Nostoc sp. FACHB-110]
MKLSLLSLLSSITLICCLTATSNVNASIINNQQSQPTSTQETDLKKQILSNLVSVGRAQQSYYLENQFFANQLKKLGLYNTVENGVSGYKWQIFTDKAAKKIAMNVLLPQQKNSRTYINFVVFTITDANEAITISTLCESEQNQLIVPKLPTKFLKNQGVECPAGFRKLELSENEANVSGNSEKEKEQKLIVSMLNSLQQEYYYRHQVFTDNVDELFGFSINKYASDQDLKIKFLPLKSIQNGIITIVPFPQQQQKSYIGIVRPNQSKIKQLDSIVCEISAQASLDLTQLNNLPPNGLLTCPQNFVKVSLNSEEATVISQELESFKKYQAEMSEINKPQKIQILQIADNLAKEGKYLESLQKYFLALEVLGITEYDILTEMNAERSYNPIADTFFQKINPILEVAKPSLLGQKRTIQSKMYALFENYKLETNSTAKKIQEVGALQLGFNILTVPSQELKISEKNMKAFGEISELLQEYFDEQSPDFNKNLPKQLRSYINKNTTAIATIRNLLLNSEIPRWGLDYKWIKEGDFQATIPSYIGMVNLQRLLIIDILDKHQQGNTQQMLQSLEASWQLSESLQDEPSLIGQLVNVIIRRSQLRVLVKIDNLPVVWQQRLLTKDYTKAMLVALNTEAFFQLQGLDKIITPEKDTPLSQLYRNWYGVNTYQLNQAFTTDIEQKKDNLCSLNLQELEKPYLSQQNIIKPSYIKEVLKAHHLMLASEMLQKALQVKATISQKKALPSSLAEMPSNICLGHKWLYKSAADGKWFIYLNKQPIWQSQIGQSPLTYTGKFDNR